MPSKSKLTNISQWIPIIMAFIAVASLAATIYFSYRQQESTKAILSVQLAMKFNDLFDSDLMRESRRNFARVMLQKNEPPDEDIIGFLDMMGFYVKRGSVDLEVIWNEFGYYMLYYWPAAKSYVKQVRNADHDQTYYENAEWLYQKIVEEDALRHHRKTIQDEPSEHELDSFLKDEANLSGGNGRHQIRHF